ncbi:hypothetical protein AAE02nite_25200 [Adhaeribacter aerolatus]|uniref:Uncharacterized protein n=1 Tax=Adhaeribacter aerolatus TaxID=670289 RepID=A0A512AYT6_9BACT|nr:hypothetical protein [Adhaeribacter aerolatus]GEO04856.1 hypothetical protein AAE02nite_25200 [Adhaeribacter aerolatus]
MTIQDYRKLLEDQEYLTQTIIPLYQQEENKLKYSKMKLLHLFFENGIQQNYNIQYLETLCSLLDNTCAQIFSYSLYNYLDPAGHESIARLLHFALPTDLELLSVNLRFHELIFSALEEYEVCANITYLHVKVLAEIDRKLAQEPQTPKNSKLL